MIRLLLLIILFLSGCGSGGNVYGGPILAEAEIKIQIIRVRGEGAITEDQALYIFDVARKRWKDEHNKILLLDGVESIDDPCAWNVQDLSKWLKNLSCVVDHAKRTGRNKTDMVYMYVLPPHLNGSGKRYYGGVANGTCSYGNRIRLNVAYSNAGEFNSDGVPRLLKSEMIFSHELGHLLGAKHYDAVNPPTVMHSAAGNYWDDVAQEMFFAATSVEQVDTCVRGAIDTLRAKFKRCKKSRKRCRRRLKKRHRLTQWITKMG